MMRDLAVLLSLLLAVVVGWETVALAGDLLDRIVRRRHRLDGLLDPRVLDEPRRRVEAALGRLPNRGAP